MTKNTKELLKSTIIGLLGGGATAALYALNNSGKDGKADQDKNNNEITVPLSRRQFLKAVRPRSTGSTESSNAAAVSSDNIGKMTPQELAALKKSLLRSKTAAANQPKCDKTSTVTTTELSETPVRRIAGAGSTFPRDKKGRFITEKKAGIVDKAINGVTDALGYAFGDTVDDAGHTMLKNIGLVGGITTGLAATKLVADRILVNKKKKQVEAARKRYVDALASEVNDEDLPYYNKSAEDTSALGSAVGLLGLAGAGASTAAAVVMYRIMENRRKAAEKAKDKDLSKYPAEKTIKFKFPKDPAIDSRFFA